MHQRNQAISSHRDLETLSGHSDLETFLTASLYYCESVLNQHYINTLSALNQYNFSRQMYFIQSVINWNVFFLEWFQPWQMGIEKKFEKKKWEENIFKLGTNFFFIFCHIYTFCKKFFLHKAVSNLTYIWRNMQTNDILISIIYTR